MFEVDEALRSEVVEVGSFKQRRTVFFFVCESCSGEIKATLSSLKYRKSKLCRKCSSSIKLDLARKVGNCNRARPYENLYNKVARSAKKKRSSF